MTNHVLIDGEMSLTTDSPGSSRLPLEAESIGYIALDTVSTAQNGLVFGKISRGIFIRSASKWLIFIGCEPFRSPLTINLGKEDASFQTIIRGMPIRMSSDQLLFPVSDLIISLQNAMVWRSPLPVLDTISAAERKQRLILAWEKISENKSNGGFDQILPLITKSIPQPTQDLFTFQSDLICLYESLSTSSHPRFLEIFLSLIGKGSGLTPSGDDIVLGSLLALNRWGDIFIPGYNPRKLNKEIVAAAYRKTTTLSANLIECATQGQADERLIAALDWLIGGSSTSTVPIDELLNWGHSSGANVLLGFIFALSIQEYFAEAE